MNAIIQVATVALAGASLVAAQAPEAAPCMSVADAVSANGLNRLAFQHPPVGRTEAFLVCLLSTAEGGMDLAQLATATEELPEDQKVTLFAPEDAAWPPAEDLPTGSDLLTILLGHVVPSYLPSPAVVAALEGGEPVTLPTLAGSEVTAMMGGEAIYVAAMGMKPGAEIVAVDVETCAGVIHVIDAVLIPTEDSMAPMPGMPPKPVEADMDGTEADGSTGTEDAGGADSGESSTRSADVVTESNGSSSIIAGAVSSAAAALALLM